MFLLNLRNSRSFYEVFAHFTHFSSFYIFAHLKKLSLILQIFVHFMFFCSFYIYIFFSFYIFFAHFQKLCIFSLFTSLSLLSPSIVESPHQHPAIATTSSSFVQILSPPSSNQCDDLNPLFLSSHFQFYHKNNQKLVFSPLIFAGNITGKPVICVREIDC